MNNPSKASEVYEGTTNTLDTEHEPISGEKLHAMNKMINAYLNGIPHIYVDPIKINDELWRMKV